jgi:hypothetical protein
MSFKPTSQLFGSSVYNYNSPNKTFPLKPGLSLDTILKDKTDSHKTLVLEFLQQYDIDEKDPSFLLWVAIAQIDINVNDIPKMVTLASIETNKTLDVLKDDNEVTHRNILSIIKKNSYNNSFVFSCGLVIAFFLGLAARGLFH